MTKVFQIKLYPRLSIDSARRVRQLGHTLNGQVCSKCGKRIVRHLPRIAGPWLAGSYDSDRAAAKGAQDALTLVFPTLEKIAGLRKTFHRPILEYCRDTLLHETVQTLSDERTVSPDDAAATYARVVATSLAVVTTLLNSLPEEETSKQYHIYEEIFGDNKLWDFANHPDVAVRRSLHRLVQSALSKQAGLIEANLKIASTAYIYKGLTSDQTGSAADYVGALDALTSSFPAIWTDAYSGKKPAISRLRQHLKHGSRSGTPTTGSVSVSSLRRSHNQYCQRRMRKPLICFTQREMVFRAERRGSTHQRLGRHTSRSSLSLQQEWEMEIERSC